MVAGHGEETAAGDEGRERGEDQLVADAVVGEVAGDEHPVGRVLDEDVSRAQEEQVRVARIVGQQALDLGAIGEALGEAALRGAHALLHERDEGALHRRLVAGLDLAARVHGAVDVDEAQLALPPLDAPAVDALDGLPDLAARRGAAVRAAARQAGDVLAEARDVQVRDVGDDERHRGAVYSASARCTS